MNVYQFIADQAPQHANRRLCQVLGVARSGYRSWRQWRPSARAQADQVLTEQIRTIHSQSRQTSGSPRVQATLRGQGQAVGRRRVARLMRVAGLCGVRGQRRRVRTTRADPTATPARDRGARAFTPAAIGAPQRCWFADSTYVATGEGWLSLAVVLDGSSRRVVGWAMADHLRAELVIDAVTMATQRRSVAAGLIHHSDQGAYYTSLAFGQRLQEAGILPSMGAVGTWYANAVVASFFASLKVECVDRQSWPTRAAVRVAIFEYIEVWYNRQRLHSTLDYRTPAQCETDTVPGVAA